ncbi:C6 transcription factor [Lasiodiplodia theobromae]|uniref:C6 transcription factor n=1 Tax=Lasiodiplodia theobromae TaxID=45133 RepID=UPI0015C37832|nr:C6 transcription factor [Lasiodiplodia theobromae]KAF4544530.1 C6 transcription factor [Lasiodiplodia theobromae]
MPDERPLPYHPGAEDDDDTATTNVVARNVTHPSSSSSSHPTEPNQPTTNLNGKRPNVTSSNSTSAAGPAGTTTANREFQRAYKACVPCRKRKARCEVAVPPDGGVPGPPCMRCKRALRECVFTEERAWKKQRLMEEEQRQRRRAGGAGRDGEGDDEDVGVGGGEDDGEAMPRRSPPPRLVQREQRRQQQQQVGGGSASAAVAAAAAAQQGDEGLADSMMRTVVASGNDALNLLFEAATREDAVAAAAASSARERGYALDAGVVPPGPAVGEGEPAMYATPGSNMSVSSGLLAPNSVQLSAASEEVLDLWKNCRFVRMGWFTAREAVTYVDLFFKNMSPLSPVLTDYYADHSKHYELVTKEPFLCFTILALSSRYHVLPGVGGASRGYFIHHRLWEHCQHLILRIMLGQEKGSTAKTRTVGSIEGLLLLAEWHPRALHFPPASDGWDSGLVAIEAHDEEEPSSPEANPSVSNRWLEDVIEPARRSDRLGDVLQDMLAIEYQFVRIFINSLGMQAVVERTLDEADDFNSPADPPNHHPIRPLSVDSTDYHFIQEVVDGSCEILRKVIKLADAQRLRFAPVRIYLHITASAIYLIKGLSLGVWNTKLPASLDVLDRGIQALRSGTLDDIHLASRFATLLEVHVARLRRSFVVSNRPPRLASRQPSAERMGPGAHGAAVSVAATTTAAAAAVTPALEQQHAQHSQQFGESDLDMNGLGESGGAGMPEDDWLALPFDPSMAPLGAGSGIQKFPGLDSGMLNFLWNLPS